MATLLITVGVPASGKSTFAAELVKQGWEEVNKDKIRATFVKETNGAWKWSQEAEKDVLMVRDTLIMGALLKGVNVVSSDCNLGNKHLNRLSQLAKRMKASFEIKDFTDVSLETCLAQNEKRLNTEDYIPPKVIMDTYTKYVEPFVKSAPYHNSKDLPWTIICDLDGTLAIHNGRSPYDTVKCEEDLLNEPISKILETFHAQGVQIIYVSGRSEEFREHTNRWLKKQPERLSMYKALFMRPSGDIRNDAIVKKEIFNAEIRDKYHVLFVLDDRDRVVKAWRDLGLTCLQCAYGNF